MEKVFYKAARMHLNGINSLFFVKFVVRNYLPTAIDILNNSSLTYRRDDFASIHITVGISHQSSFFAANFNRQEGSPGSHGE